MMKSKDYDASDYDDDYDDDDDDYDDYDDYDDDNERYGQYFDVSNVQSLLYRIRWFARRLALRVRLLVDADFRRRYNDIPF